MLTLVVFVLAVYGLANAIAMLKIGVYFFGDPVDQIVLKDGTKALWKALTKKSIDFIEFEDTNGAIRNVRRDDVDRILSRKGLGRIPYLGDMFYCPACLSFWIGMATSAWIASPAGQVCPVTWKAVLLDGLMACGASWLLHLAATRMMKEEA